MASDALPPILSKVLPPKRFLTGDAIPPRYRLDSLRPHRGSLLPEEGVLPAAVVLPTSTAEVSALLRLASENGIPVTARGAGTGLMGGARPRADAIVLDLTGMNRVRNVDCSSGMATAEAGIVLENLDRRLRRRGMTLGHDPWSRPRATLGGAISTNGLGYAGYLRGSMGDQVLGLEVVLADGAVVRTRPVPRTTAGLDLKRLFIGTEGVLGVVTAATLRAFPLPEREEIHAFAFRDFASGLSCLSDVYDAGLVPSAMDFEETLPSPVTPWPSNHGPPTLYLGFAGAAEAVRGSWAAAGRRLRRHGARRLPDPEARAFWRARHDVIYRTDEVAPGVTAADRFLKDVIFDYLHVALPRTKVLTFRRSALAILRRRGVTPIGVGLWTQPELVSLEMIRPVGPDRRADKAAVHAACEEVLHRVHALGGTMEYVHGVGAELAPLMEEELGPGLKVYRRVKAALDPQGLLNPEKGAL